MPDAHCSTTEELHQYPFCVPSGVRLCHLNRYSLSILNGDRQPDRNVACREGLQG